METMLFDIRDVDLDAFIADQRGQGFALTRTEAIEKYCAPTLMKKDLFVTPPPHT